MLPSLTAFEAAQPCEKSHLLRTPGSRMGFPFAAGMKSSGGITMSSAAFQLRNGFRPKLLALSVAACFSLSSTQSLANPTGGSVSSGSAGFASSGNTLSVTNSANAIINWQSFSIGVNEITRFVQSSASSAVLNRVVGANGVIPQSVIDGVLSSNGRVFLINQSGILFGANARIDVAGFVASSLNLSDQAFLNGRLRFTETPGAGGVSNAGVIDTSLGGAGGRVFLVGPDVRNSGLIRSPQGQIVLAAGKSVELVSENSPFVTVRVVADTEQALNVGQLISDSGRIGMFGALVRQGGGVEANSAVVRANGEIRLVATRDLTLDAGSRATANAARGGARGGNGGFVETSGRALQAFGSVDTSAPRGNGGEWLLDPLDINIAATGLDLLTCLGGTGICFDDLPLLGNVSQISAGTIDAGLRTNGSVTLQAHHDINLQTNLNLTYGGGSFTAQAGNNINLGGNITANGTNITLTANDLLSQTPSGTGSITSLSGYGNIATAGGNVNLSGFGVTIGAINTTGGPLGAGSVTVGATADIATGSITTASRAAGFGGGFVDLFTSGGKVTVNGSIDTTGALGGTASADGSKGGGAATTGAGARGHPRGILHSRR